jgi:hypothetical protein
MCKFTRKINQPEKQDFQTTQKMNFFFFFFLTKGNNFNSVVAKKLGILPTNYKLTPQLKERKKKAQKQFKPCSS